VDERAGNGSGRRIVIGIGNADRGDDAVGLLTARMLEGRLPDGVQVIAHNGEATSLLEHLEGAQAAYLVDAAVSDAAPGTVRRFDCSESPLPGGELTMSTHGFGPAEAIELARALGRLPAECIVFAIEARGVEVGEDLSGMMRDAAADVASRIAAELAPDPATNPATPGD